MIDYKDLVIGKKIWTTEEPLFHGYKGDVNFPSYVEVENIIRKNDGRTRAILKFIDGENAGHTVEANTLAMFRTQKEALQAYIDYITTEFEQDKKSFEYHLNLAKEAMYEDADFANSHKED